MGQTQFKEGQKFKRHSGHMSNMTKTEADLIVHTPQESQDDPRDVDMFV